MVKLFISVKNELICYNRIYLLKDMVYEFLNIEWVVFLLKRLIWENYLYVGWEC